MLSKCHVLAGAMAVIGLFVCGSVAFGHGVPITWALARHIHDGECMEVSVVPPTGKATEWHDGDTCDGGHATAHNGVKFAHNHYTFSYSGDHVHGIRIVNGQPVEYDMTTDKVNTYWVHQKYPASTYTQEACGNQERYNCFGYALGFTDIWINNVQPIYSNDYYYDTPDVAAIGAVDGSTGHAIKVEDTRTINNEVYVTRTREKMRDSCIFKRDWPHQSGYKSPQQTHFYKITS